MNAGKLLLEPSLKMRQQTTKEDLQSSPHLSLQIPSIVSFVLRKCVDDEPIGLVIVQGTGNAAEVARIIPNSPASKTPLEPGFQILSINNRKIRYAEQCISIMKSGARHDNLEIVASTGGCPPKSRYVMIKRKESSRGKKCFLEDGSFQGLFLSDFGGSICVSGIGEKGLFATSGIKQGEDLLAVNGYPIRCMDDCEKGINNYCPGHIFLLMRRTSNTDNVTEVLPPKSAVRRKSESSGPDDEVNVFNRFLPRPNKAVFRENPSPSKEKKSNTPQQNFVRRKSESAVPDDEINGLNKFLRRSNTALLGGDSTSSNDKNPKNKSQDIKIKDFYDFGIEIGSGSYSVVKKATHKETGKTYAIKIVKTKGMDEDSILALKDEVSILRELKHKHVMRMHDMFVTKTSCYLVTEYLEGGELFDRIVTKYTYTEAEARDVCKRLFDAVNYLHTRQIPIAHRDLKPENLLLRSKSNDFDISICDFGFAGRCPTDYSLKTDCGSPDYVSPEILRKVPYGTKTDMWSLGVIIFSLIGGYSPFDHENNIVKTANIKKGDFNFNDEAWDNVSNDAKDLIKSLLCVDPKKRISAKEAMDHPWMFADKQKLINSNLLRPRHLIKKWNLRSSFHSATESLRSSLKL